MARAILTPTERFMAKVEPEPNTGCWLWLGRVNHNGYGSFDILGISGLAHRFSYSAFVGEIPRGKMVLHRCDVRSCVCPSHLFLGNLQANSTDMARKNRGRKSGVGLPYGVRMEARSSTPNPFQAQVRILGVRYSLGSFQTAEIAGEVAMKFKHSRIAAIEAEES